MSSFLEERFPLDVRPGMSYADAYTVLITEGGSGNVIEARDEYAAAYEDLKRIEAAHPEYTR